MRVLASAAAIAVVLTAARSLAVVTLRDDQRGAAATTLAEPPADRHLPAIGPAAAGAFTIRRRLQARGRDITAPIATPPRRDVAFPDVVPGRLTVADGSGDTPNVSAPPDSAITRSVSRVMYCHLDTGDPAALLQQCLDRAPAFSSVEIPPGTYTLARRVLVSRPVTIRTAGTAGAGISCAATPAACARLAASRDFLDAYGVLLVWRTASVQLQHLVIDGNRAARAESTAARWCELGRTSSGFNAAVLDCEGCALDDLVSEHALCGTALAWSGARASIVRSEFRDNGDAGSPHMWADGLTVLYAPESTIRGNRFVDNSDIGLIVGHAARSRIDSNVIVQRRQRAFAGLMIDNFNSNRLDARGDFRGAVIARNLIDCAAQLCVFGIQVGPRPWYPTRNIVGGELSDNEVRGAAIGINIDGAGVHMAPTVVYRNRVEGVLRGGRFADCERDISTAALNISPTSIVRTERDAAPDAAHLSDRCQFWSGVTTLVP